MVVQRQDGQRHMRRCAVLFAWRVGACCVMAVVDYDVVRADAARAAEEKVGVVRGLVSKLGKAQRAAEATLDMCHKRCAGK